MTLRFGFDGVWQTTPIFQDEAQNHDKDVENLQQDAPHDQPASNAKRQGENVEHKQENEANHGLLMSFLTFFLHQIHTMKSHTPLLSRAAMIPTTHPTIVNPDTMIPNMDVCGTMLTIKLTIANN